MSTQVYREATMHQALASVRRDLGPDAIIVATMRLPLPKGGVEVHAHRQAAAPPQTEHRALAAAAGAVTPDAERTLSHWMHTDPSAKRTLKWLARSGIEATVARQVLCELQAALGSELPSPRQLRPTLAAILERLVGFAATELPTTRLLAFVGPTGAGKTTTLAKIAARAALGAGKRTALITMDNYRIGGVEQLERYADLIGIPIQHAFDAAALQAALQHFAAAELILIDTEGRSPRDGAALAQLGKILADCQPQVQLCLPAALPLRELPALVDSYAALHPDALAITKLDEATYHGSIVSAQAATHLPLTFFATGQRVPEDLEAATATRLAALICGEELCQW